MGKRRLNIGLLINEYCDIFAKEVCTGAMYAAEEIDANLFILAGGYFDAPYMDRNKSKYEYQNNYLFNFATKENIDVLIVLLGTIASNVDESIHKKFLEKFEGIPIITIASKVEGYANISFDNKEGFAKEIDYLINYLGKRKIGIVCGPATNEDSIERLDAYKETLQKNHLPVEDKRIVYGNFTEYSEAAIEELLDQNEDLDAIVFSNDYMALGGYRVLQARGIVPGKDITVVGFDDSPFAALMEPSLTTTRANSSELGYRAVKEACKLKPGDDTDIRIETVFIERESSGNRGRNALTRAENKFEFDPEKQDAGELIKQISGVLFDSYTQKETVDFIEETLERFVNWMMKNVYRKSITDELYTEISQQFLSLNTEIMERLDNIHLVYEISEYLVLLFAKFLETDRDRLKMYAALAECYKNILLIHERKRSYDSREHEIVNRVTMTIMRDLISEDDQSENFDVLLSRMNHLDFNKSYILLFPKVTRCRKNGKWKMPDKLLIKAYQKGKNSYTPPESEQELTVADIFRNPFLEDDKRKTYAVSFLFSRDEQYGLFVVEPNLENMITIEPVTFQISSAIQTMRLFKSKEDVSAKLEESLEQLKETNAFLDEVSKSDELTHIYNRRGFLVTARKVMRDPENYNKCAVVLYADMNNLKLINDKFGHEEGDYSLRSIAQILKDALGENEIIGRFGGDEFAAFLFMEDRNYEQILRGKITEATEKLNAGNDKPYYISMSVGISSFINDKDADMNDAMVRADVDLYLQKKHKRNKILK
ncbi:MAG: GGDEF domain-containing protein [Lachnospiraceae bacterium]